MSPSQGGQSPVRPRCPRQLRANTWHQSQRRCLLVRRERHWDIQLTGQPANRADQRQEDVMPLPISSFDSPAIADTPLLLPL
ncbi:hypothetical protein BCR44DRAFT_1443484, partial [Catenaria anguillulae PL171]